MNKMQSTSKKLDIFFHILQVVLTIGAVASVVVLVIIAAFFFFDLRPEQVGTGYNMLDLGYLKLALHENATPAAANILAISAADTVMGCIIILLSRSAVTCIRSLLQPMREGLPFHGTASAALKKLALLTMVLGVVINVSDLVNRLLVLRCYDLPNLLLGDKIIHVSVENVFDLSFVVVGAVLLLLSYIFRYGEELQQLSDETL